MANRALEFKHRLAAASNKIADLADYINEFDDDCELDNIATGLQTIDEALEGLQAAKDEADGNDDEEETDDDDDDD